MIDLGADGKSPNVLWRYGPRQHRNQKRQPARHHVHADRHGGLHLRRRQLRRDSAASTPTPAASMWETHDATGRGRWWNAFLIPHDDRVVICNEQGDIIFAKLAGDGYHELSRAKLIEPTQPIQRRMTVWSHPAFAMHSVFARNDGELIRVNLAED